MTNSILQIALQGDRDRPGQYRRRLMRGSGHRWNTSRQVLSDNLIEPHGMRRKTRKAVVDRDNVVDVVRVRGENNTDQVTGIQAMHEIWRRSIQCLLFEYFAGVAVGHSRTEPFKD